MTTEPQPDVEAMQVSVSGFDGQPISSTLLTRPGVLPRAPGTTVPLVVLPGHMRPARTLLPFAEAVLRAGVTDRVLLVDYRGRGRSAPRSDPSLYTPGNDAADVTSVLDALNWHHCDIVGSAHGGLVAMMLGSGRPTLIRRLVLNDIGPELDGIGIARLRISAARHALPADWEAASADLRQSEGARFTALAESDWDEWARLAYEEDPDGKPADVVHDDVRRHFASIDSDERYPTLWPQFAALRSRPVMLLRAQNSDMLTDAVADRMRAIHPRLVVEPVVGQGHAPLLHLQSLTAAIGAFLSAKTPAG